MEFGLHCAGRDECHRMGGLSPNAKQHIVHIKINDGKHPMRTFGPCPRNTRKWKQTFDLPNSRERINARVGRDFQLDDHFLRGKSAMHLRIAGRMAIILAIALGCQEKNKPDKMRSLVTSLAAPGLDLAARNGRHRHGRNSKIVEISPFRRTKILGQSAEFAITNIFMPQPTRGNQQFRPQFLSNWKL